MLGERRKHYRRRMNLPLHYTIAGNHFTAEKRATTGNISDSGVCFYTDVDLKKGSVLEIHIPGVLDAPRKGTVRWTIRKYFSNFTIGVSFDDQNDHHEPPDGHKGEQEAFHASS